MIYNPTKPILNEDSFKISKDTIEQLNKLNQIIMDYHFKNTQILKSDYISLFTSLYEDNLCELGTV